MSQANEDNTSGTNLEQQEKEASACGAGCSCHGGAPSGRARWVVGAVILAIAAALAVRAAVKDPAAAMASPASESTFATPACAGVTVAAEAVAESSAAEPAAAVTQTNEAAVGTQIGSFAELSELPPETTVVFVFVPSREPGSAAAAGAPMEAAARTILAQGGKVGLLTLRTTSPDYAPVARQVGTPGALVLVKGRGMAAVSGEITETKLVQAFVAASNTGGGCCPGGAASSGCR